MIFTIERKNDKHYKSANTANVPNENVNILDWEKFLLLAPANWLMIDLMTSNCMNMTSTLQALFGPASHTKTH